MELGPHTVTVLRPPAADRNGGVNWDAATQIVHSGCSVQPLTGAEVTDLRDTVTGRKHMWTSGTDIRASDRAKHAGLTYEVTGEPQRWDFAPMSHTYALLTRVEG